MKLFLGIFLIVAGIGVGFYVGIWLLLVGSIVDIVNMIHNSELMKGRLAWDITKILLASLSGTLSGILFIVPGLTITKNL